MREINYIIIHHSASPATTTAAEIDAWHKARGWRGIGYHYVIHMDKDTGRPVVEKGRAIEERGAHCRPRNKDSIGVCLAGDYSEESPDPAMWDALVREVAGLVRDHHIPISRVMGHREAQPGHTACPGGGIDLDLLRSDVSDQLCVWEGIDPDPAVEEDEDWGWMIVDDEEIDSQAQTQAGLEAAMAYFGAE